MKIDEIIIKISELENISAENFKQYVKSFEKYIKSEIRKYDDNSGLEDFKMNKKDYKILYELHNQTGSSPYKIHILLLYMYSFYKLDGISFNKDNFPLKLFLKFIDNNKNIHTLMFNLVTKEK